MPAVRPRVVPVRRPASVQRPNVESVRVGAVPKRPLLELGNHPDFGLWKFSRFGLPGSLYGRQVAHCRALGVHHCFYAYSFDWHPVFIFGCHYPVRLKYGAQKVFFNEPWTSHERYLCCVRSVYYGPDATNSVFEADTCHINLDLPTCALWVPDPDAFMQLLTIQAPSFLGGWCLVGVISASMSTGSGAVLAMGTVMAHNVVRQLDRWYPNFVTSDNLLQAARFTTLPFALASTLIAGYYRSSSSNGGTGYLLIVAFDIVLATVVVPLFGCFYAVSPSPRAALVCIVGGVTTRIILEFTLPKDGYFLMPYDDPAFLDYGPAASYNYPSFIDVNATQIWNPAAEPCDQRQFKDFTGVDSLSALLAGFLLYTGIQTIEFRTGKALFKFGGMEGYIKDTTEHPLGKSEGHGEGTVADDKEGKPSEDGDKVLDISESYDEIES